MPPTKQKDYTPLLIAILVASTLVLLDLVGFLGWYKNARSYITYPIDALINTIGMNTSHTVESTLHGTTLKKENLALRQKVIELESLVNNYSEQVQRAPELQKLYDATKTASYRKTEQAEIFDIHAEHLSGKLLLNKGSSSGIRTGMPVVISNFYLGYISNVTIFDSVCTTFAIPGQEYVGYVQAKKITGIARVGINGIELGDLLATEQVSLYDIVTIKRDGFPYFYTLGKISKIPKNNGSAERTATVESPLDLQSLTFVTIVKE